MIKKKDLLKNAISLAILVLLVLIDFLIIANNVKIIVII